MEHRQFHVSKFLSLKKSVCSRSHCVTMRNRPHIPKSDTTRYAALRTLRPSVLGPIVLCSFWFEEQFIYPFRFRAAICYL